MHSVCNSLLFILVLKRLLRNLCTGVPLELLSTEDLVLIPDTLEECISKFKARKAGLESKGVHGDMKMTNFLVCGICHDVIKSGKHPCDVCRSEVGNNSIECSQYKVWVHKTCSSIGWLLAHPNYICSICHDKDHGQETCDSGGSGCRWLDVEATICYLGDMLCSGGGCDCAITARCCVAWGKFRKLLPVLTTRHPSSMVHGKVCTACVYSVLLPSSEACGPKASDLWGQYHNGCFIICWIYGIKDQHETPPATGSGLSAGSSFANRD